MPSNDEASKNIAKGNKSKFVFHELIAELEKKLDLVKSGNPYGASANLSQLSSECYQVMKLVDGIVSCVHEQDEYQLTKMNLVMKASKIGLWDMTIVEGDPVNPNNTFIWSDEFRHMLGYSNEKDFPNVLNSWSNKLHPSDKARVLDSFAKHLLDLTGKTPYDLEYRLLKQDGEYSYFHAFGETIRDKQGHPLRVAGAVEDITAEKNIALEKETMETRFTLLQKSIHIALWDMVVDPIDPVGGNNEFWWSQEFRHLLGFSNEADFPNVLGSWSNRLHPEDKEKTLKAFAAHLMDKTGNTPYNVEYRVEKKTGEYVWLKADGSTLRSDDGTPIRVVGSVEDMTGRMNQDKRDAYIVQFSQAIEEMTQRIGVIINSTNSIANSQESNLMEAEKLQKDAAETKSIVSAIKSIASQSNILGINASIESTHAGAEGKGFAVVAMEISNLAKKSQDSSSQVEVKLKVIQDAIVKITDAIKNTTNLVNDQNQTISELKENLDRVNSMYGELVSMIK